VLSDSARGWQIYLWSPNSGAATPWFQVPAEQIVGGAGTDPLNTFVSAGSAWSQLGYLHPRWSTILNAFVFLQDRYPGVKMPTTQIIVWKLTPPPRGRRLTGTWTFSTETVVSSDGSVMNIVSNDPKADSGTVKGTFGRFVECPRLDARHEAEGPACTLRGNVKVRCFPL
jgi:hypothetical protein